MIGWLMSWVWWAWDTLWWLVTSAGSFLIEWARRHPYAAAVAVLAFLRMWGVTVQSGTTGVLFSWGWPVRTLGPGFHPLIPLFQTVRVMPTRSVTLALPPQRVTSRDGLVFDADATLVCRITDPVKATVEINDLRAGCLAMLSLACADIIGEKSREELLAKHGLDEALSQRVQEGIARWGVTVEQAGFNTIAPTRTTTRLSQQVKRLRERASALRGMMAAGLPVDAALPLLGTTRQVMGHSRWRYQKKRLRPAPPILDPLVAAEEEVEDDEAVLTF
jgi:hypothetical protein